MSHRFNSEIVALVAPDESRKQQLSNLLWISLNPLAIDHAVWDHRHLPGVTVPDRLRPSARVNYDGIDKKVHPLMIEVEEPRKREISVLRIVVGHHNGGSSQETE